MPGTPGRCSVPTICSNRRYVLTMSSRRPRSSSSAADRLDPARLGERVRLDPGAEVGALRAAARTARPRTAPGSTATAGRRAGQVGRRRRLRRRPVRRGAAGQPAGPRRAPSERRTALASGIAAGRVEHVHRVRVRSRAAAAPPRPPPGRSGCACSDGVSIEKPRRSTTSKPCRAEQLGRPARGTARRTSARRRAGGPAGAAPSWRCRGSPPPAGRRPVSGSACAANASARSRIASSTLSSSRNMVTSAGRAGVHRRRHRPVRRHLVELGLRRRPRRPWPSSRPTCRSRARRGPARAACGSPGRCRRRSRAAPAPRRRTPAVTRPRR